MWFDKKYARLIINRTVETTFRTQRKKLKKYILYSGVD